MIQANHADFANQVLASIVELTEHDDEWASHSDQKFDRFTSARLTREADKIIDVAMKLAIKSLIELNTSMDLDEAARLFERSVKVCDYDSTWVNMIDILRVRGFFQKASEISMRALERHHSIEVLNNAAFVGLLTNDLSMLTLINDIDGVKDIKDYERGEFLMKSVAYTPRAVALNKKIGIDADSQSRAITEILEFIASKCFKVKSVNTFNDIFYDSLPVEIVVNSRSIEDILNLNDELTDFMITRDFDLLKLTVSITSAH